MTELERLAKALEADWAHKGLRSFQMERRDSLQIVRTILTAMRGLGFGMVKDIRDEVDPHGLDELAMSTVEEVITAMIDAILNEPQP